MSAKDEFSKEQLNAVVKIDKLYALDAECERALNYIHKNQICYRVNEDLEQFDFIVPSMLCALVSMIKNGELIYKEL